MRPEFGPIEFPDCVLHILCPKIFNYSSAILINICITDVPCFPHMILEVLPTARGGKSCQNKVFISQTFFQPKKMSTYMRQSLDTETFLKQDLDHYLPCLLFQNLCHDDLCLHLYLFLLRMHLQVLFLFLGEIPLEACIHRSHNRLEHEQHLRHPC